ncbi:MAG: hypothetical protein AAF682_02870 [Planctomycetota bacterium]
MTELIDRAQVELLRAFRDTDVLARATERVVGELERALRAALDLPRSAMRLQGAEAPALLERMIPVVEASVRGAVNGMSPTHWLWVLRRVPLEVFGCGSGAAYDRALAELLTVDAVPERARVRMTALGEMAYRVDRVTLFRLGKLVAGALYLSNLHSIYRWACKGAPIVVRGGRLAVEAEPALEEAVKLYDRRSASTRGPLDRTGTAAARFDDEGDDSEALLFVTAMGSTRMTLPGETVRLPVDEASFRAAYSANALSLGELRSWLASAQHPWPREARVLVRLLRIGFGFLVQHRQGAFQLLSRGYLVIDEPRFKELALERLSQLGALPADEPRDGEELLAALVEVKPSAWPVRPGPPVRLEGGKVWLDLYAASNRLETAMELPELDGDAPNRRARAFENEVQALLDASEYRPPDELRALRRTQLRVDGDFFTDLDAIGCRGDDLLLVSCKSLRRTASYEQGEHATVRNRSDEVQKACRAWIDKVAHLRREPRGDNFDLSRFRRIDGVVCTPTPIFVPLGSATEDVLPGLLRATSYGELRGWLRRGGAADAA